jgi:hypothetical protein
MGLLRQETQLFAAIWLGTMDDVVPEAGDAREVSDRLVEAADAANAAPCQQPNYRRTVESSFDDQAPLAHHSCWVH